jgi:hypothetical protein
VTAAGLITCVPHSARYASSKLRIELLILVKECEL